MCERIEQQLVSDGLEVKPEAKQKPLRVAKTPGCHVNGRPMDGIGVHRHHDLYTIWKRMRERCNSPNCHKFKDYGGRGITVCQRWDNFVVFAADMGPRPTKKHQIDRINNDGNYEPGNCKWSTNKENCRHRRSTRYLTFGDKVLPLCVWAEIVGISEEGITSRLKRGWSLEKALTTPKQSDFNHKQAWETRRRKQQ